MEDDYKQVIQPQRRLNPKVQDVVKNEIVKLLDSRLIYTILDSSWDIPIHVVPKKGGMTVVLNDNNEIILSHTVTGWIVCIDYRKLNDATRKDHFPLPFIDQMLELNLDRMLARCEETNLVLNWEKCHFMVKEGIVLGHKISEAGIEVDRAKIDVIAKFPYPTNMKGVRSFLGHAGFYRRAGYFFLGFLTSARTWFELRFKVEKSCEDEMKVEVVMVRKSKMVTSSLLSVQLVVVAYKEVMEVLVRCWSDGDVVVRSCASIIVKKVYEARFFWPSIFKDAKYYVMRCDACQRFGNISSKSEMPQNNIQVKAQALPTNDARIVINFLRRLFARFGVPKALISDQSKHFGNSQLEKALQKYGVAHKLSTAYHPQTNRETEVTNMAIKRILERSIGYNLKNWSKKLDDALWASNIKHIGLHGDKNFKVGDKVLLFNSRFKMHPGKLKFRWYWPNVVKTVYPYGTIEIIDRNRIRFKVNRQRLEKYHDEHTDVEDKEVVEFEQDTTNGYSRKGQNKSQKQTKPSTGWKSQNQSEAKGRTKLLMLWNNIRKFTPGASGSNTGETTAVLCYNCIRVRVILPSNASKPKVEKDDTANSAKIASIANLSRNGTDALMELFELSELKAQSQAKDTVIVKLKEQIKSLKGNVEDSSVKMDMDK
ncbi:reverse transcriptase domain-containing protein [Tanacetum coccineum]